MCVSDVFLVESSTEIVGIELFTLSFCVESKSILTELPVTSFSIVVMFGNSYISSSSSMSSNERNSMFCIGISVFSIAEISSFVKV